LLLLFLMMTNLAYSQREEPILPFFNNGKWGYMNKAKEIIVCPIFEEAYVPYDYYSGVARIKIKGKYGYINQTGEIIIKPKFDEAEDFNRGIAKVKKRNEVYFIKPNGERNTEMIGGCGNHNGCFNRVSEIDFSEIIAEDENEGLNVILRTYYRDDQNKVRYTQDTTHTEFDSIGAIAYNLMYFVRKNRIAFVSKQDFWKGDNYNILDKLEFVYEAIEFFDCEYYCDRTHEVIGVKKDGLWGYRKVDDIEKDFIEIKYFSVTSFATNYALVEYERDKFGYIDRRGNEYFFR